MQLCKCTGEMNRCLKDHRTSPKDGQQSGLCQMPRNAPASLRYLLDMMSAKMSELDKQIGMIGHTVDV